LEPVVSSEAESLRDDLAAARIERWKGCRTTERYRNRLPWACEHFSDLKAVRRTYRCSSALLQRVLYVGAARPLYGWLPEKVQPVVPAVLAVLPAIALQFGLVATKLDFAEAVVIALGALGTAVRGGVVHNA
jgi:hypothetical protein